MSKRSGRTGSVSFWRNLFLSAAEQQRQQIELEIRRIEELSSTLCKALEPMVETLQKEKTAHPSFYGCVQVLRALDARKQRLELFEEIDSRESIFNVEQVLNAPLLVQTNPVECSNESQYGIDSNNLESFVELFVHVLEAEQVSVQ